MACLKVDVSFLGLRPQLRVYQDRPSSATHPIDELTANGHLHQPWQRRLPGYLPGAELVGNLDQTVMDEVFRIATELRNAMSQGVADQPPQNKICFRLFERATFDVVIEHLEPPRLR